MYMVGRAATAKQDFSELSMEKLAQCYLHVLLVVRACYTTHAICMSGQLMHSLATAFEP